MPKIDLFFSSPLMNAAGSLGFAPEARGLVDISRLGAFVANPVSLRERTPAHERCVIDFPGGFLLHTGHPNPGIRKVIRRYAAQWRRSELPVLVHLLAGNPEEVAAMVRRLELVEGVMGIELGLPPDCDAQATARLVEAAAGELPVVVHVPLERALEIAPMLAGLPVEAISLGAPRGALPWPGGSLRRGRLYGPAISPLALETVRRLAESGIPVIGAGGVYHPEEVDAMLAAGAIAVQLDSVLWRGGFFTVLG